MPDFTLVLRSSLTRWLTPHPAQRDRPHPAVFLGFVVVCVLAATLYVAFAMRRTTQPAAPRVGPLLPTAAHGITPDANSAEAQADPMLDGLRRAPRIYYRSLREGERGGIVIAALAAPEEQRLVTRL